MLHFLLLYCVSFCWLVCKIRVPKFNEKICMFYRCHGFKHNDIQLKNTQHNTLKCDTEHKWTRHNSLLNAAFFIVILCVVLLISVSKLECQNLMKKFACFIGAVPFSIMTHTLMTFSSKTLSLTLLNVILSKNELSILVC